MRLKHAALGIVLLSSSLATIRAQTATPAPETPITLDVVSIRPNNSGSRNFGGSFTLTGVRIVNLPISMVIEMAYFPSFKGNQVIGLPPWTQEERYDIVGRFDDASATAWLKLAPRQYFPAGRPLLQKILADRCKLVAHLVPSQVDGYTLVVSKRGTHLTPAKPGETYPDGIKNLADGGKIVIESQSSGNVMRFFNASIQEVSDIIGPMSGSVLENQTNLTGRYDFAIRRLRVQKDPDGNPIISNPQPSDVWDMSDTGLEFKHAKIPSQNLVIDHIERPTPN